MISAGFYSVRGLPTMTRLRFGFGILASLIGVTSAHGQTDGMRGAVRRSDDSTAVAGVGVRLAELRLATTSNARGTFQFARVPVGRWLLQLRRIGFTPLDTPVEMSVQSRVVLALVLNAAPPSLDTVNVTARLPSTATIPEFTWRRDHATGRYITRDELRAMDHRDFIEVLRARVPGLLFQRAARGVWAYSPSQQAPRR